jgi:hypothetical protein
MKNPTISGLIGGKLVWLISAAYLHNGVTKKPVVVVEEVTEDDDDLEPADGDGCTQGNSGGDADSNHDDGGKDEDEVVESDDRDE